MARGILWARVVAPGSLLEAVPPRFEQVRAHHLTLKFGVELAPFRDLIGKTFRARAVSEAWNDQIQAVRVELPPEWAALSDTPHPHVTIAHATGVPPKLSTPLLEAPPYQRPLEQTLDFMVETQRWSR